MAAIVLIFVPLREEMNYIHLHLKAVGSHLIGGIEFDERDETFNYSFVTPNKFHMHLRFRLLGRMGNIRTAADTLPLILEEQADIVILTGLAGSLDPRTARLGDVFVSDTAKFLFADKIKEFDEDEVRLSLSEAGDTRMLIDDRKVVLGKSYLRYRREIAQSLRTRTVLARYLQATRSREPMELEPVDREAFSESETLPDETLFNAEPRVGAAMVLGSDMVVDSSEWIEFLQMRNVDDSGDWYRQKAAREGRPGTETGDLNDGRNDWRKGPIPIVDMESYGFFSAIEAVSRHRVLHAFAVRGVSDLAADKGRLEKNSKNRIRSIAARNAVKVALDVLVNAFEGEASLRS